MSNTLKFECMNNANPLFIVDSNLGVINYNSNNFKYSNINFTSLLTSSSLGIICSNELIFLYSNNIL